MKTEDLAIAALFLLNVAQLVIGFRLQRELWNRVQHPDRVPGDPPAKPKGRTWTDADEAKLAAGRSGDNL